MTADSGFAGRLAYVRWLRARGRVAPETDREFAEALGVTYGWFAKWKIRPDAPDGRTETKAIERALAPMGVSGEWLFDNRGRPPEPGLWAVWSGGATPVEGLPQTPARRAPMYHGTEPGTAKRQQEAQGTPAPRKAAGGKRQK